MKLVGKIFVGLGVAFAGFVVLAGVVFYLQSDFRREHEGFVRSFMAEYSRHWDVGDVRKDVSSEFLERVSSPGGDQAVAFFRRMGRIRAIEDLSLENFHTGTRGTVGEFVFKAEFENAAAVVNLTLKEVDEEPRVHGLHITPIDGPPASEPVETQI